MRKESKIKVSIIIYVKNAEDYIEKCIRSVMNQTLIEIEILVIDGGSTDSTLDIIKGMKKEDCRIRIFHSIASVGGQFNLGLREASGQYIGICEADDYILPEMYERQYQIAVKNQLDVIRAGYYRVLNIENIEYRFKLESCYQNELMERVIISDKDTFFLKQGINGFWSGLYRRQFLLDHHIWMNETKGAAYQDISISFLTQLYAKRIWFMKEAFYCYRIDNPNASINSLYGIELHIGEYEELKKRMKGSNQWEQYKNIFFSWELISYRWFLIGLPNDLRRENARKVYYYLKIQSKKDKYDIEQVMVTVRSLAKSLNSETEFVQCILSETVNRDNLIKNIGSFLEDNKEIILFGVGYIGNIVRQFFELCEKEILFMDNNKTLQKNGFKGNAVYRPEDVTNRFPNGKYIIASVSYTAEMKEQLLKLGVQSRNILICDDEEFFLRKIFVKARKYSKL